MRTLLLCGVFGVSLLGQSRADESALARNIEQAEERVVALIHAGDVSAALPLAKQELALAQEHFGPDHYLTALTLNNLADIYALGGDYQTADPLLLEARRIAELRLGTGHPIRVSILASLAYLKQMEGDFSEAEELWRRVVAMREVTLGAKDPQTAGAVNNLAILYSLKGDYSKAEQLLKRALSTMQQAHGLNHPDTATTAANLGRFYLLHGDSEKAEPLLRKAMDIRSKALGSQHADTARSWIDFAKLDLRRGNYRAAEQLLDRAVAALGRALGPHYPDTIEATALLADVYSEIGSYGRAEELMEQVLDVQESRLGPYHPDVAKALNALGGLYWRKGDYGRAIDLIRRVTEIEVKAWGPDHPDSATALTNLAAVYLDSGDANVPLAVELLERALNIRENVSAALDQSSIANSLTTLGAAYYVNGDTDRAKQTLKRAVALSERTTGATSPDTARALTNLGIALCGESDWAGGESALGRALAINESVLGTEHPDTASALQNLAALYFARGEYERAIPLISRSLEVQHKNLLRSLATGSERQKDLWMSTLAGSTDAAVSLVFAHNTTDVAEIAATAVLNRKGRVIEETGYEIQAARHRLGPEGLALADQLVDVRAKLSALALQYPDSVLVAERRVTQMAQLEQAEDRVLRAISSKSAVIGSRLRRAEVKDIQAALPADSVLLEFIRYRQFRPQATLDRNFGPGRYAVFALRSDRPPLWVDLGDSEGIDVTCLQFRYALGHLQNSGQGIEIAAALYRQLIVPIRSELANSTLVLIAPDGLLNLIPFDALTNEVGIPLVKELALSYLTTGRELLQVKDDEPSRSPSVLIANPDYGTDVGSDGSRSYRSLQPQPFRQLPGTATEARLLRDVFGVEPLEGGMATKAALQSVRGPRILHVATHGFFLPDLPEHVPGVGSSVGLVGGYTHTEGGDPMLLSGLAFAGANGETGWSDAGIETAKEVSTVDMFGTQLATLSACDTGVGETRNGEGVAGLRRALVLAGARAQMISLWRIDDEVTAELMASFYKMALAGVPLGEALRRVQLEMIDQGFEPYYWAPFILSGHPGKIGL